MTNDRRSSAVISARVSPDTKASFAALAARYRLSESRLLAKMVHEVIQSNGPISHEPNTQRAADDLGGGVDVADRITLRLRPGDRECVARRAHARDMKTGSYLALLIHNHVHASAVLPPNELAQIRAVGAQLAALGRQLRVFGMTNNPAGSAALDLGETIALVRREVELAREATAAVVRRNLISWEAGGEGVHAKQMVRLDRSSRGSADASRDMTLDIVSYGRRGPGGRLSLGSDEIAQVQRTVGRVPEVMVKVSGGARDLGGVEVHLRYISRHGKLPLETDEGMAQQGRGAARDIVTDWQLELCRSQYKPKPAQGQKDARAKLVQNIVLSMPAGTPPEKVLAAARVFARENFAMQYRYAVVLHTDQPHPHVHLVVKCEHEFEPGKRLYIRKETLRQWREQFAALMREQGVPANATPRQVRGQVRKPYRDAIHHRLRALRAFAQLPIAEREGRRAPAPSTVMRRKLEGVLHHLKAGRNAFAAGEGKVHDTRKDVLADWHATAAQLKRQGEAGLAVQVDRFTARMPKVQTEDQRLAQRWREVQKGQMRERSDVKLPEPRAR